MTDREAFTAAYMAACKDRPADWNEIGYWYARQLWDAAAAHEREACAKVCDRMPTEYSGYKIHREVLVASCAEAIRSRAALKESP